MSFNVTVAWPLAIVCASDRRLVDLRSGKIRTNRSTKMTLFGCSDAHGVIVYNGTGMDDAGMTPSDWLLELERRKNCSAAEFAMSCSGLGLISRIDSTKSAQDMVPRRPGTRSRSPLGTIASAVCMVSRTTSASTTARNSLKEPQR